MPDEQTDAEVPSAVPQDHPVFLLGPPGVGKTELGTRVCVALGQTFAAWAPRDATPPAGVFEVPWEAALEPGLIERLRRIGTTVGLWDRPEQMQARASRPYQLRPSRAATLSPYGRRGTNCLEYRRLIRGCDEVLLLDDLSIDEAAQELAQVLREVTTSQGAEMNDRFANRLVELWVADMSARRDTARVLARAMADFLGARMAQGMSSRSRSALESDLHVAGILSFMYDSHTPAKVLDAFRHGAQHAFAFSQKISSSPAASTRYRRACDAFAAFLETRS